MVFQILFAADQTESHVEHPSAAVTKSAPAERVNDQGLGALLVEKFLKAHGQLYEQKVPAMDLPSFRNNGHNAMVHRTGED